MYTYHQPLFVNKRQPYTTLTTYLLKVLLLRQVGHIKAFVNCNNINNSHRIIHYNNSQ